ncbi:hypothetical protein [Rugamonas apoptosis]|uniref:Uncharacterized protein n=1 Tax=Rugamonas apoptosis TaxID=2758570 RepID=A0A7W2IK46_9BURK|nr:hypothetical protein [Rugamonas apoptosis]MBA5686971.1 hypothetical protein [Rugamonas apoptosis]
MKTIFTQPDKGKNMLRHDTEEFMRKAREFGLIEEMDRELELRKNEERLAVIAELASLPSAEQAGLPALTEAATKARRALELAQEAYMAADRAYKESSMQVYGAQLKFDGARNSLELRARELSPQFMRDAYEDLAILDGHVQGQFRYEHESVADGWFGGRRTVTTSNGDAMLACRTTIADAQKRLLAMMLESAPFEESQAETERLVEAAKAQAFALGVSKQEWTERRKPKDKDDKVEAAAHRANVRRSKQIATLTP